MTICLLIDYKVFDEMKLRSSSREIFAAPQINFDDDVEEEISKVKNLSLLEIAKRNLVVKEITKTYGNFTAVNQLHLEVKSSECFGLLGVNGAGKTSTFKMMMGDESITVGNAWLKGTDVRKQNNDKGYCPQFDALLLELTARETLEIFALIRGIPRSDIVETIDKVSSEFGFKKHLDKKTKILSGGNKRKLSTAVALLGDPLVIFLDEPSSGMDPGAKRRLWDVVNGLRNAGKSIILTTHSMDEAENLCTRLAIMVEGEFKCIGSVQHLKNKFVKGFVLTIKMQHENDEELLNEIKTRIAQNFPSAKLKGNFMKLLTFHVAEDNLKWSRIFAVMTQMKNEVEISDFTVSQTSMNEVFLFFSKQPMKSVAE